MKENARTWKQIIEPQPQAADSKLFEKKPIKWTHEHENAEAELREILKREKATDHKTRVFISTGDAELDKLCR